jgi:hypothetical protein
MVNGPTLGRSSGNIYSTVRARMQASTGHRPAERDVANETNGLKKLNNISDRQAGRMTEAQLAGLRTSDQQGSGGHAV